MAKRLTRALGIDIGTQSIKAAGISLGKDRPQVDALGKGATPENAIDHTGIFDPTSLGNALRTILSEAGMLGWKDVIFCISGQQAVLVRNLEVPRMSDKELSDHMQWEIQRNIPFAESTVVSDYRPVENPALDGTDNMEVVMAVSPQSAIEAILELIRAAGCKPAAIDVEPLAIGRVLRSCYPGDLGAKNTCVVNFGNSMTSINMYRSGVLSFPRSIPSGGAALTKAIADSSGITSAEAEASKASVVIPAPTSGEPTETYQPYNPFSEAEAAPAAEGDVPVESTPAPIAPLPTGDSKLFDAIQPQVVDFVAELRRSIDYYRSRGGAIEQIALTGGSSALTGLAAYVESSLGLPTALLDPFQNLDVASGVETFARANASEFAVAVGMGLHIAYD
jgi:type IV pilus assembly protein PilM